VLERGDVALMTRGCDHVLATAAVLPPEPLPRAQLAEVAEVLEGGGDCAVVSGAYQLWNPPLHPLFAALPAWTILPAAVRPPRSPLAPLVDLLAAEAARDAPAAETIVHGLLDATFGYLLRELLAAHEHAATPGWPRAIGHDRVRRAITLLHADTARDWTLDALAREVSLSRSALAQQFRAATGDTPLNYLRGLRMQRAMRLLGESDRPLDAVAAEVGYRDAFGFSKVFKRLVGIAPRDWRRRDLAERAAPGRL
jgi:AraC-like DNA-binding protein